MKISRRRLARFILQTQTPSAAELAEILTGRGLEVESCAPVATASGIVFAKVRTVAPHPNADKLHLCEVDVGDGTARKIVCGADNVRAGMTVALAPPGARLGKTKISKRAIRGEESEGMICSEKELGVGEDAAGILSLDDCDGAGAVTVGESAEESLALNDDILDIAVTPNRGDCLSHLGIAREVCAHFGSPPQPPAVEHRADIDETFPVEIEAPAACPYYGCVVLRGVADAAQQSPLWLRSLLERCGMRPVGAVVDVTNYLALAWGQPLHAFDLDKLHSGIRVRFAKDGEKLPLLDGANPALSPDVLLIADGKGGVAIGGVMGGAASAVGARTQNILLEAASFAPETVRGKTRRFQLSSEAAFRFERGVDAALPPRALAEAARLIKEICGGKAGPVHSAGTPPPARGTIAVGGDAMRGVLGMPEISDAAAAKMLNAMGIQSEHSGGELRARPPSWRFDLELPEDIMEEVVRAHGYGKMRESAPLARAVFAPPPPRFCAAAARRFFAARGFCEIVSYAFVPREWERQFGAGDAVALQNPISEDMAVMRTQLFAGLMAAARFNARRRQERAALFELGRCFRAEDGDYPAEAGDGNGNDNGNDDHRVNSPGNDGHRNDNLSDGAKVRHLKKLPAQSLRLGGLLWGDSAPTQWQGNRPGDFFDLRGLLEDFLRGAEAEFAPLPEGEESPKFFHPRRVARILLNGKEAGALGECHPRVAGKWDFRTPPLFFELDFDLLQKTAGMKTVAPVSRFPLVWRDLALFAPADFAAGELLARARAAAKAPAAAVDLFDSYAGGNIPQGQKSVALRVMLQGAESNLTEKDINSAVEKICAALRQCGAKLREAE